MLVHLSSELIKVTQSLFLFFYCSVFWCFFLLFSHVFIYCILYVLLNSSFASFIPDHQNFFGMDERLGPVAVSFRREEKEGSSGSQYNYRIIFRTTEVNTTLSHTQKSLKKILKHFHSLIQRSYLIFLSIFIFSLRSTYNALHVTGQK